MAELDEDAPIRGTADTTDTDLSDETQDFRFLASLSQSPISQTPASLPRRGEKDFESHGTQAQSTVLAASRQAMHDALSHTRTHHPRMSLVGLYDPTADDDDDGDDGEDGGDTVVTIPRPTGPHFKTIGRGDAQGQMRLLPEEALYLLERGSLDVRWTGVAELEGLPMSLQAAYTYFAGSRGLSLERYAVYTALKRSGYIVQRAPTWHTRHHDRVSVPPRLAATAGAAESNQGGNADDGKTSASKFFVWLYRSLLPNLFPRSSLSPPFPSPPAGPLVQPGLYRSYTGIYQQLALIPFHNPTQPTPREQSPPIPPPSSVPPPSIPSSPSNPPLRPTFHVWKPAAIATFKKTAPPPPDFRIVVIDARTQPFPTYEQLDDVLQCVPYDPPPPLMAGGGSDGSGGGGTASQMYARLRHGYRHIILAVVDQGVISYVRIGDAGFGLEKVWERQERKGGKGNRGGRGGGRGRGGGSRGGRGGGRGKKS